MIAAIPEPVGEVDEAVDDPVPVMSRAPADGKAVEFMPLLRRRMIHALVLGFAFAASDIAQSYPSPMLPDSLYRQGAGAVLDNLSSFLVLVIALTTMEVAIPASRWRLPAMIAVVIAIGIAISELRPLLFWRYVLGFDEAGDPMELYSLYLYLSWGAVASGTLLAIFYEWQARNERVMEAVRVRRIAGEIVERNILDARLGSLKAKVDPKLLFAVVERAQVLYGQSAEAAELLLERLIEFLRASLPPSQALSVTIEQEATLCRIYLELEKAMRQDAFTCETRVAPALAGVYFPPAVLLPLVRTMLAASANAGRQPHLSIIAERDRACMRIELTCHATSPPPTREALDTARTALREFFGDQVAVAAIAAPFKGRLIRIEVPHAAT